MLEVAVYKCGWRTPARSCSCAPLLDHGVAEGWCLRGASVRVFCAVLSSEMRCCVSVALVWMFLVLFQSIFIESVLLCSL